MCNALLKIESNGLIDSFCCSVKFIVLSCALDQMRDIFISLYNPEYVPSSVYGRDSWRDLIPYHSRFLDRDYNIIYIRSNLQY